MTQPTKPERTPYVSIKRSEPRVINGPPPIFDKNYDETKYLAKYAKPEEGRLTYRRSGPGFLETYAASKVKNRSLILSRFSNHYGRIREILELEYRIATSYFWIVNGIAYAEVNPVYGILQRTFAGNLVALNSALELTLDGVYSNARLLMRQSYEGAMIAKLCSIDPSSDVYDRWLDGQYIVFSADILKRIVTPQVTEFRRFWQCLSGDTHASLLSGQPDFQNRPAVEAAPLNLVFIEMLLEANYHLLCSHLVTPSMRYYQRAMVPDEELDTDRHALKALFRKRQVPWMAKCARTFIRDFRSTWSLTKAHP
jgi:hypothetical protein